MIDTMQKTLTAPNTEALQELIQSEQSNGWTLIGRIQKRTRKKGNYYAAIVRKPL